MSLGQNQNTEPRLVSVSMTDPDATDSSSDEDESVLPRRRRVTRSVNEIVYRPSFFSDQNQKKYRGVRQRQWGKWTSEIRDPILGKTIWLGTFASAEDAAVTYDNAAIRFRGSNARTNIIAVAAQEQEPIRTDLDEDSSSTNFIAAQEQEPIRRDLDEDSSSTNFIAPPEQEPIRRDLDEGSSIQYHYPIPYLDNNYFFNGSLMQDIYFYDLPMYPMRSSDNDFKFEDVDSIFSDLDDFEIL